MRAKLHNYLYRALFLSIIILDRVARTISHTCSINQLVASTSHCSYLHIRHTFIYLFSYLFKFCTHFRKKNCRWNFFNGSIVNRIKFLYVLYKKFYKKLCHTEEYYYYRIETPPRYPFIKIIILPCRARSKCYSSLRGVRRIFSESRGLKKIIKSLYTTLCT